MLCFTHTKYYLFFCIFLHNLSRELENEQQYFVYFEECDI